MQNNGIFTKIQADAELLKFAAWLILLDAVGEIGYSLYLLIQSLFFSGTMLIGPVFALWNLYAGIGLFRRSRRCRIYLLIYLGCAILWLCCRIWVSRNSGSTPWLNFFGLVLYAVVFGILMHPGVRALFAKRDHFPTREQQS